MKAPLYRQRIMEILLGDLLGNKRGVWIACWLLVCYDMALYQYLISAAFP